MVTRTFDNLIWEAHAPSVYQLVGYPGVVCRFNGKQWVIDNVSETFNSMEEASELVNECIEIIRKRKNPK